MNEQDIKTDNYGPDYIGNVIRILDTQTLVVNVGAEKLQEGDEIKVYTPVDPLYNVDGSLLCMYEYTKDTLTVTDVNKKYSVCRKMKKKTVESSMTSVATILSLSPLFDENKEPIPLNINDNDISPIKDFNRKIQIGDPIKLA